MPPAGGCPIRKTLHPTAFMINRDQHTRSRCVNGLRQRRELFAIFIVARKQNDAASERMPDATDVVVGQCSADHIEHDRPEIRDDICDC